MTIANYEVEIPTEGGVVLGTLSVPPHARGVVVFAHGSGSSRFSQRNTYVARVLQKASIATLLVDLLTEQEDAHPEARFDIPLLASRLIAATRWVASQPSVNHFYPLVILARVPARQPP